MDLFCEKKISYARRDWKLLSATDRMPFPERNRCLILMAFIHGFRASELLGLRLSDIDLAGRQLYIRRLKNGFSTCHPSFPMSITYWKAGSGPGSILRKGLTETGCSCRYDGIRSAGNNFLHTSWGRAVGRINDSATSSYAATCLRLRPCW